MEIPDIIRPGTVYYTSMESDGIVELKEAYHLHGVTLYGIYGNTNTDSVLAMTDKGVYNVSSDTYITDIPFTSFGCGYNYCVGVTSVGAVYSWGEGRYGELGLGSSKVVNQNPVQLPINTPIVSVISGDNFTFGQDKNGNIFTWGQNFDKQLGLYMKQVENKNTSSPSVTITEEMIYIPRLVPISLKYPIKQIACGPNFSICVTKSGKVYSWGSGECGQLGTGRCTNRESPMEVILSQNENITAINVSCGMGHVLILSDTGNIYCWGLNTHGQLGLGHTTTRYSPEQISLRSQYDDNILIARSVYSDGYTSAFIDQNGKLYTWGSTLYNRLMQSVEILEGNSFLSLPTLVMAMSDNDIESIAFAKKSSAIVIRASLSSIRPNIGPQKSFSELIISGYGFYQSENIIIKFISKNLASLRTAPRSCLGRWISSNSIQCKPPKLSDYGEYDVSIALDGKVFIPDAIKLQVYKDFSISDIVPRLVDIRTIVDNSIPVKLICKHLTVQSGTEVQIKLTLSAYAKESMEVPSQIIEFTIPGMIQSFDEIFPNFVGTVVVNTQSQTENMSISATPMSLPMTPIPTNASVVATSSIVGGGVAGMMMMNTLPKISGDNTIPMSMEPDTKVVTGTIDLTLHEIQEILCDRNNQIILIQAQITANDQDYCPITNKNNSIILHQFQPHLLLPNCCPMDSIAISGQSISIQGHSFIPSQFLSKGMEIYSVLHIHDCDIIGIGSNNENSGNIIFEKVMKSWEGVVSIKVESYGDISIRCYDIMKQIDLFIQSLNSMTSDGNNEDDDEEDHENGPIFSPRRYTISDIKSAVLEISYHIRYKPKYRLMSSPSPFVTEVLFYPTPILSNRISINNSITKVTEVTTSSTEPIATPDISSTFMPVSEPMSVSMPMTLTLYTPIALQVSPNLWRNKVSSQGIEFKVDILLTEPIAMLSRNVRIAIRNKPDTESTDSIIAYIYDVLFEVVDYGNPSKNSCSNTNTNTNSNHTMNDTTNTVDEIPPSETLQDMIEKISQPIEMKHYYTLSFIVPSLHTLLYDEINSNTSSNGALAAVESTSSIADTTTTTKPTTSSVTTKNSAKSTVESPKPKDKSTSASKNKNSNVTIKSDRKSSVESIIPPNTELSAGKPISEIISEPLLNESLNQAAIGTVIGVESINSSSVKSTKPLIMDGIIYLDLQLDGKTPSPESYQCPVRVVSDLIITQPIIVPKGGAVPKSKISMEVSGFIPSITSDMLMIRIRGSTDKQIILSAEIITPVSSYADMINNIDGNNDIYNNTTATIAFVLPEATAMAGMKPDVNKNKEKRFYVDISIDGGITYDNATVATLQLKI